MYKAILLRVALIEWHADFYLSRRDTVDFSTERGHKCLTPETFSNFALKWFHKAPLRLTTPLLVLVRSGFVFPALARLKPGLGMDRYCLEIFPSILGKPDLNKL